MNKNLRKKEKNDVERDFFKFMNNAVFGKTIKNMRKHKKNLSHQKEEGTT